MIPLFLDKYREGYDVVYGIRMNRKEVWWMRVCFKSFYRLFNAISERPVPQDAGDFGLISNRVAKAISAMPEYDRMLWGLRSWVGVLRESLTVCVDTRSCRSGRCCFWESLSSLWAFAIWLGVTSAGSSEGLILFRAGAR
jgi:hypothetical protein